MKRSMSQYEELHYNINVRCERGWPSPTLYMSYYGEIKWASTRKLKKKDSFRYIVNPVFSEYIKQDTSLAFQTDGCLLLYESSAKSHA